MPNPCVVCRSNKRKLLCLSCRTRTCCRRKKTNRWREQLEVVLRVPNARRLLRCPIPNDPKGQQVEERQSQPRPLTTADIPTIIYAVLQACQNSGLLAIMGTLETILHYVETTTRLLVVPQMIQSQILPPNYRHPHAKSSKACSKDGLWWVY